METKKLLEDLKNRPAFPHDFYNDVESGMTKRFYAACSAMQGLLSYQDLNMIKFSFEQIIPKLALMYADELIKQENADELIKQE